ncbi:TGS domain-containing protein, partial [Acinetobacter baumannii]
MLSIMSGKLDMARFDDPRFPPFLLLSLGAPGARAGRMSDLLKITLPEGSLREVPRGTTPADIAAAIGP